LADCETIIHDSGILRGQVGKGMRCLQPLFQQRYPPTGIHVLDGDGQGLACAHQHHQLAAAGNGGVQQIPLEQGVVPGVDRQDD
jgi:hypothetical protein